MRHLNLHLIIITTAEFQFKNKTKFLIDTREITELCFAVWASYRFIVCLILSSVDIIILLNDKIMCEASAIPQFHKNESLAGKYYIYISVPRSGEEKE